MKINVYLTFIGLLFSLTGYSQSCLPEGIVFHYQSEIDNFQTNYPGCTEIEGDVVIGPASYLYNLNGLSVLTSIGGGLRMYYNPELVSISGLQNITSIGGWLFIEENEALTSLEGLENLDTIGDDLRLRMNGSLYDIEALSGLNYIGGDVSVESSSLHDLAGLENISVIEGYLSIVHNNDLTSLTGLEGLTSIGDYLEIQQNYFLVSLAGLANLMSIGSDLRIGTGLGGNQALINLVGLANLHLIGGNLWIIDNPSLTDLTGLDSLISIGGSIEIEENTSLTSLFGIENIVAGTITDIQIINNDTLATCDVQSICEYLASPNGTIEIHDNFTGCNSQEEVEAACLNNCLPDGITFTTQAQIDSFQVNYPTCTEIQGSVTIWGGDIVNLDGLINITKIGGYLEIRSNPDLTNLAGLNNVTRIGSTLEIWGCFALTSIDGIKNIDASSITNLHIVGNTSLSQCAVQSVCDYLANPNGFFEIYGNGSGCGSEGEVFDQCIEDVKKSKQIDNFTIFPNPATAAITITLPTTTHVNNITLSIYNVHSQQVISRHITEPITVLDIGILSLGVYFVRVTTDASVMVSKFIKQ